MLVNIETQILARTTIVSAMDMGAKAFALCPEAWIAVSKKLLCTAIKVKPFPPNSSLSVRILRKRSGLIVTDFDLRWY